jgi:hypothetical protein
LKASVRPLCMAHLTKPHSALRGSGPGKPHRSAALTLYRERSFRLLPTQHARLPSMRQQWRAVPFREFSPKQRLRWSFQRAGAPRSATSMVPSSRPTNARPQPALTISPDLSNGADGFRWRKSTHRWIRYGAVGATRSRPHASGRNPGLGRSPGE